MNNAKFTPGSPLGLWEELKHECAVKAELLAALEACLSVDFDCDDDGVSCLTEAIREKARAAIAKARGEPPASPLWPDGVESKKLMTLSLSFWLRKRSKDYWTQRNARRDIAYRLRQGSLVLSPKGKGNRAWKRALALSKPKPNEIVWPDYAL